MRCNQIDHEVIQIYNRDPVYIIGMERPPLEEQP